MKLFSEAFLSRRTSASGCSEGLSDQPALFLLSAFCRKYLQRGFSGRKTAPVPLGQFKDEPFVLLKQEKTPAGASTRLCQANGFSPRVVLELDQQMTSYHITCAGMGISFISDTLVRHVTPHPDVIYYKLPGEETRRNLYFYWKNGKYISRAMEEFLNLAIVQ